MKTLTSAMLISVAAFAIIGCSGGGGSNDGVAGVGTFVDSAVEGLDYHSSPSGFGGRTNADGKYNFTSGDTVKFSIGGVVLGEMKATTAPVSPVNLFPGATSSDQRVVNIARVLQSLDENGQQGDGIKITPESARILTGEVGCVEGEGCSVDLSTYDTVGLTTLLDDVVALTVAEDKVVTEEYASDHLDSTLGLGIEMFRKNISKTPEMGSSKPKMNIMSIYVDAQKADGTAVYTDDTNTTRLRVHPIVSTYADAVESDMVIWDGSAAHDTFAAISLDDGATWKRINLSRTAKRSSFDIVVRGENGDIALEDDGVTPRTRPYPGHSHKPVMQARGNNILVVWDDKFCRSGNPLGLIAYEEDGVTPIDGNISDYDGNVTYVDDKYLVNGPQLSVDYADVLVNGSYPFTAVGEVPYSCVMASRTVINPDADTDAGEKVITTYVAEQVTSGRRDALQIFLASSPNNAGFGFTWQEDPEGLRPGSGKGPGAGWGGATTNHKTDIWYSFMKTSNFAAIDEDHVPSGDVDQDQISTDGEDDDNVTVRPHALNKFSLPVRISNNAVCTKENADAGKSAQYCKYMCDTYGVYENADDMNDTANGKCYGPGTDIISGEQFILDGDTGASRPNIFLQPGKYNGEDRVIAIFGYEETKGLGDGADDDHVAPEGPDDNVSWEDTGKYVIYESFPFDEPEVLGDSTDTLHVVSGGHILNQPNALGVYENARRIRFIPQGMKSMQTSVEKIVLGAVYKEGMEGQGRPSDIMLARFKGGYAFGNLVPEQVNISSVGIVTTEDTQGDTNTTDGNNTKVTEWDWDTENLNDESDTNPYDDARAHRGQIRGDFLIVAYSWTPNWAAARQAHDKYDVFVRRSFDGGVTWTNVAGDSEGPVNVSNLANNKETVIEPRLVATPGTILTDGVVADPKDKQNKSVYFITYGTAENIADVVGSIDEDTDIEAGAPLDLYYSRTTDKGETYEMVEKTITSEDSNLTGETVEEMDWFAHSNAEEGEIQIRMTPDGSVFYGSWIQDLDMDDADTPDHFKGSDIWFRKIDYNLIVDDNVTE